MKNLRVLFFASVLIAVSVSCSLFSSAATSTLNPTSAQPQTNPSGFISSVTMSKTTEGTNLDPVNPTTVFSPSDIFHAVVTIVNAPDNTVFEAVWNTVDVGSSSDNNSKIDSSQLTAGGSENLDFTLTPASTWATGTYDVEIYVDGTLDQVVNFSVK